MRWPNTRGSLTRLRNCVRRVARLGYKARMQRMPSTDIFAEILGRVRAASEALIAVGILPSGIDQSRVTEEPPRDVAHGDMSTNAAMVLAKDAGRKPRELAEAIAEKLRADVLVAEAEVAGP